MKLSDLVEEKSEHRQELSESKFKELLSERAKNSHVIASQVPFFRQDKGPEMQLVTPAQREEKSAFWVNKLIKEVTGWKRFPSRERFIKAYTKFDRTHGGDDVYVLIPFDGAKIGISPTYSFYRSFIDLQKCFDIDRVDNAALTDWLNRVNEALAQLTDHKLSRAEPKTFGQFKSALDKLDKLIKEERERLKRELSHSESITTEQAKLVKDLLMRHIVSIEQYLHEKLEPEVNGFSTLRIESFSRSGDYEVWVDSPCLLIKRTKYIEMFKRGDL